MTQSEQQAFDQSDLSVTTQGPVHEHQLEDIRDFLPQNLAEFDDQWNLIYSSGCTPAGLREIHQRSTELLAALEPSSMPVLHAQLVKLEQTLQAQLQATGSVEPGLVELIDKLIHGLAKSLETDLAQSALTESSISMGSPPGPQSRTEAPLTEPLKRPVVFVLEPDSSVRRNLVRSLNSHGFQAVPLADLAEFRTATRTFQPAALVLDLAIAGQGGQRELAALTLTANAAESRVNIVFLANHNDAKTRLQALAAGGSAFMTKPVDENALASLLWEWLDIKAGGPNHVLLVHPDETLRATISRMLRGHDIQVRSAGDALAAWEAALARPPETVLLNWALPGAHGLDFARVLRQEEVFLTVPIIFFGAPPLPQDQDRALALGATDFLAEPWDPERLVNLVKARCHLQRRIHARLRSLREIEPATGLHTANYFAHRVQKALRSPPPANTVRALIFSSLDGYAAWQRQMDSQCLSCLMADIALALRAQLGPSDIAAYFGEGHFALVLQRPTPADIEHFVETFRQILATINTEGVHLDSPLTASHALLRLDQSRDMGRIIGLARSGADNIRLLGGDRFLWLQTSEQETISEEQRRHWTRIIHSAINDRRLFLVFQPIASMTQRDGIERYEILLRLALDSGEGVVVSEFFRMAERIGLARLVDRWVLYRALTTLMKQQKNRPGTTFFVKIGSGSINDEGFIHWLRSTLKRLTPVPGSLVIQLSETDVLANPGAVQRLATAAQGLEIRLAMEHFGLSNDTLRLLQEIQPSFVKFAESVTGGIQNSPHKLARFQSLLKAVQSQGVSTMAAFVEDASGLAMLWESRVDFLQGNFLKRANETIQYDLPL